MRKILLTVVLFFIFLSSMFAGDQEMLYRANGLYDEAQYGDAISLYEKYETQESLNGQMHFNLGNIYFRDGQLGKAIFHYYKASRLMPRDGDVAFNLKYAREKSVDKIDKNSGYFFNKISFKVFLSSKEKLYFLTFLVGFLGLTLFIYLFSKNEWFKWGSFSLVSILIVFCCISVVDSLSDFKLGVITSKEAPVYSTTAINSITLFSLHEGGEFKVLDILENKWILIELMDGKKGWIKINNAII